MLDEKARTVLIAGDLAPVGRPEAALVDQDIGRVFGDALPVMQGADYFVVNLECPLTASTEKLCKAGPNMKADPRVTPALKDAGVSLASLANNHIFDYGVAGVRDTIAALTQNAIDWVGVGENLEEAKKPWFVDLDGVRVGFLCYAEHEFNWQGDDQWCTSMLEPAENMLQIRQVSEECSALIILIHGGPEEWHYPSPRMLRVCRAFAEAGASAVLVGHAHAVMGSEVWQGVPIVYGLGNFVFHCENNGAISWRVGLLERLSIKPEGVLHLEHIPVLAAPKTGYVRLLKCSEREKFDAFYKELCRPLHDVAQIAEHWRLFCTSQVPHLTREVLKGCVAMCPGTLLRRIVPLRMHSHDTSYYRKGASLLRGLVTCENHQDVLKEVGELLRLGLLRHYRRKLRYDSAVPKMVLDE